MSENWDFYMCQVDGEPASIYLDMGLAKAVPYPDFPNMGFISLTMNSPRSDGLSSHEEFDALVEIEDHLQDVLCASGDIVYVGRNTSDGCRDFYFYMVETETWKERVSGAMSRFPDYACDIGTREDPEWNTYRNFLYPSDIDQQVMGNRRLLDVLQERGDTLEKAREIQHWIYFRNVLGRQLFEAKVKAKGFDVSGTTEPDGEATEFGISIVRIDTPSHEEINNLTIQLFKLAQDCGGLYDGWETLVETV